MHVQSSMKPIVGRDSLFGYSGTITIIVHTSKGMNYAPFALRLSSWWESSRSEADRSKEEEDEGETYQNLMIPNSATQNTVIQTDIFDVWKRYE